MAADHIPTSRGLIGALELPLNLALGYCAVAGIPPLATP